MAGSARHRSPGPRRGARDRAGSRARGTGSVRVRTTLAAALVVGGALVSASAGLVWSTRHSVHENVRDSAQLYAADLARQLGPGVKPVTLTMPDQDELLVQILTADARVVRASPVLLGRPALAAPAPGQAKDIGRATRDDRFLAVAAASEDGRYTVLVAKSVDVVGESTQAVIGFLVIGVPLLVLLVGVTTWRVVGRTLAPVDAIRREVDAISSAELHRRVPAGQGGDEIARLADTMNQMLCRLEEGQSRLRRFVSDASHELRSPVAVIRQHVEVALAHPDRTSVPELAGTVLAEGLRVQQLIDDLLLLARADEDAPVPGQAVDLDDLVFAEASRLRRATGLRIDTTGVSAGRVLGDAGSLSRVLRNLGDNAARHASGTVAFSLREVNGHVVAAVDDDGPGIPEEERGRVFYRFVRLDEARARDDGGAGLGLSIVAQLVAAHRGTVAAAAAPLGGARFELQFPRHDACGSNSLAEDRDKT